MVFLLDNTNIEELKLPQAGGISRAPVEDLEILK